MRQFAKLCEQIAATTKKLEKTALVAAYLKSRPPGEAAVAAVFLSGRPFPVWEETTLQVGGSLLWRVVAELSGKNETELHAAYRRSGDLGWVAADVLPAKQDSDTSVEHVQQDLRKIAAARGLAAKTAMVRALLAQLSPREAKYVVKIMTGDLRIGLKESLVEEAIANAYGAPLAQAQRANMLLGDIGETLRFAHAGTLDQARMRLFHPLGFMLASPAASAKEAIEEFASGRKERKKNTRPTGDREKEDQSGAAHPKKACPNEDRPNSDQPGENGQTGKIRVEDKYDGIRAQAHCSSGEVRIFSRTRDDITESFPEIAEALSNVEGDAILDGEIVAWSYLAGDGRALPFSALQQRLGRKRVNDELMERVPVAYLVFDVLYFDKLDPANIANSPSPSANNFPESNSNDQKSSKDDLLIDRPLCKRAAILEKLLARRSISLSVKPNPAPSPVSARSSYISQPSLRFNGEHLNPTQIIRAPVYYAATAEELDALFAAAQVRGNEGLMIKDPASAYTPGRRGKSWLKLKRELATLDVVVTAVEYGHGRRIGVLSDYTFAVWDGKRLVNIGKAYSGLTDAEIAEMTQWFLAHTVEDQGFRLAVEPKIVLEVAFNNMMRSDRHESGYALRFPRIVRLRPDKLPEEADTLERAREIFARQNG